jgi:hypothetical protein
LKKRNGLELRPFSRPDAVPTGNSTGGGSFCVLENSGHVALTAARAAFSPTDAMPYTRRAKLVMAAENLLSFSTLAFIVARAVNVARG